MASRPNARPVDSVTLSDEQKKKAIKLWNLLLEFLTAAAEALGLLNWMEDHTLHYGALPGQALYRLYLQHLQGDASAMSGFYYAINREDLDMESLLKRLGFRVPMGTIVEIEGSVTDAAEMDDLTILYVGLDDAKNATTLKDEVGLVGIENDYDEFFSEIVNSLFSHIQDRSDTFLQKHPLRDVNRERWLSFFHEELKVT